MKTNLPLLLATVAASAFAETADPTNSFGVLRVDSTLAKTIVAVPWVALNDTGTDSAIKVADYIKTENLTVGDYLHVYDASTGIYKNWILTNLTNNGWAPVSTATEGNTTPDPSLEADAYGLTRGSALWLERQNPTNNVGQAIPFYIYGQVAVGDVTTTFVPGTSATAPVWNLVANPNDAAYSLNSITGMNEKDVIYLVNDSNAPKKVFQNKKTKKWGYTQMVEDPDDPGEYLAEFVTPVSIPQGTGFWYVSAGGVPNFHWKPEEE